MKKLLTIVAALFVSASVFAQTTAEDQTIKVDVGFGSAVGGIPVGVSYEKPVTEFSDGSFITVGGYLGYEGNTDGYQGYEWKRRQLAIMAQGNYYVKPLVDKLDIYAGLRLGYLGITSKNVYADGTELKDNWGSPFGYSVHAGVNYWFSSAIAVNAELGYGVAYLNVGLAFKF